MYIILKIEVYYSHCHWKFHFSNPEKGPKSEENERPLPRYWKVGYGYGPVIEAEVHYLQLKVCMVTGEYYYLSPSKTRLSLPSAYNTIVSTMFSSQFYQCTTFSDQQCQSQQTSPQVWILD